jgi:hypothetical protein
VNSITGLAVATVKSDTQVALEQRQPMIGEGFATVNDFAVDQIDPRIPGLLGWPKIEDQPGRRVVSNVS